MKISTFHYPKALNGIRSFLEKYRLPTRIIFFVLGIASTVWFLARVIPKPSRATYPCMQATAPFMSSFVIYLLSLGTSVFAFRKSRALLLKTRYVAAAGLFVAGIVAVVVAITSNNSKTWAKNKEIVAIHEANKPIGEAKGIFPGRVVWVWNPDATNENCKNSYGKANLTTDDDGWFMDKNNNQPVIDQMLSDVIQKLTGKTSDADAWDAIFKHFNKQKHDVEEGYMYGEVVFIKINVTSSWGFGETWGNISSDFTKMQNSSYGISETSPHVIMALLKQLVDVVGVPQDKIYVGDPLKHLYKHQVDLWKSKYPNVKFIDNMYATYGRTRILPTDKPLVFYSDKGTVIKEKSDALYDIHELADYMINVPTMKAHARAGITLFAKNHFGSHSRSDASHLHPGLVAPNEGPPTRTKMGMYRTQVDLMGHELLGGNTLFFLLDALWSGSEATQPPTKWTTAPFNTDWTSSIFASFDPVAIESVAFDFLRTEYTGGSKVNYPQMDGTDDYLEQAADPTKWPSGIKYDPEGDGTPIKSLGVDEHWDNPVDKRYSRNLGTGNGIELVSVPGNLVGIQDNKSLEQYFSLEQNYPNPFVNTTNIRYNLKSAGKVIIEVYDIKGYLIKQLVNQSAAAGNYTVQWDGTSSGGGKVANGNYLTRMTVESKIGIYTQSQRVQLIR